MILCYYLLLNPPAKVSFFIKKYFKSQKIKSNSQNICTKTKKSVFLCLISNKELI